MSRLTVFDREPETSSLADQAARELALDPRNDVVLEASAGTGKTRVLVGRYVRLLDAGVDPRNVLAITFTRKAAAEMRDRVVAELRQRAIEQSLSDAGRRALHERLADIQISTIDAFCVSLLREFPLEAGVDPGFEIADETETARFGREAVDAALRAARAAVLDDESVRLLLARVREKVLARSLAPLLDRRHVALPAVASFVRGKSRQASATSIAAAFVEKLRGVFAGPLRSALLDDGPLGSPEFCRLHADLTALDAIDGSDPVRVRRIRRRVERHFLTQAGAPRRRLQRGLSVELFSSPAARKRHEYAVGAAAPGIAAAVAALEADVNALLARGLLRVLRIAADRYERLLDERALLDFPGLLDRSVRLLARQEEFARSRLKLQSRFHHVLVDEFQDTSRLQWRLVELLVDAWGEGEGVADAPTSIFVVGDRKQSIYRFRQAEVTLLDEAARKIARLRPGRAVRQAIRTSFRAVPELLAFVNAFAGALQSDESIDERFVYGDDDRFPVPALADGALRAGEPVLGIVAEASMPRTAEAVGAEIERLLAATLVRDRRGPMRPARPDDVAILFRARAGHRYFSEALERRGIRTHVHKGLGFFDAPEVQDAQALIRYLAQPESDLRAAELLRSRIVRLTDEALAALAPDFARAVRDPLFTPPPLDDRDARLLAAVRAGAADWLESVDRIPPGELVDRVLEETVYALELGGRREAQARENLKKVRDLIRRIESRGYATLGRLAAYFDTLRAGDESHAVVEASGCVNLMTIHAAKGLEFPIVFVVNLHLAGRQPLTGVTVIERGAGGGPEVAFGATDATTLEERREREELRRLFYVAVTRARDRLYLTAAVDGRSRLLRGARSLAALLPADVAALFTAAAQSADGAPVAWAREGRRYAFRACRSADAAVERANDPTTEIILPAAVSPLVVEGRRRIGAAEAIADVDPTSPGADLQPDAAARDTSPSARLAGTLVHRLFQRGVAPSSHDLEDAILRLARREELVDVPDRSAFAAEVAAMFKALASRPDVSELLASGTCRFELPFSYAMPDRPGELIRGAIDCAIFHADGTATVLEFKTGRPRPAHAAQARLYARALAHALGCDCVTGRILYP